jgi:alanine racemase
MLYQTHVRVHLDNIRHNIEGIRKAVGAGRKILIAVKANAYGHGAVEVSRMAQEAGVNWLGVATVPEGIQLRAAGIQLPILKFSPTFPEEMAAAVDNGITLAICDSESAQGLQAACNEVKKQVNIHMKVDTGMGRIGVTPNNAPGLAVFIEKSCPDVHLQGIFTHLPVSDAGDNEFTHTQIAKFKETIAKVETAIGRKIEISHCSNSGAVLGYPEAWLDMVRPGIMIYGYYPDQRTPHTIQLKPGMSFLTRVSFIKKVAKGTSIGYGRTWVAGQDTIIATIPAGYADGFNRLWSNTGRVLINGKSYPVVGRVCMDQSMVDLGPETDIKVGDEVVLIGKSGEAEITCDEWAEKLHTITYEITSQINQRVARIY